MKKFEKNRSVDSSYLNTPIKYCLGTKGRFSNKKYKEPKIPDSELEKLDKLEIFSDKWYELHEKLKGKYLKKKIKQDYNKDFVVLDFYGKSKCLCAWRNNITCKIGITFICQIIKRNKKYYIKYKNQLLPLETNSGWVI